MRITYLHQYFNTPGMSGGTRSYEMARRLVEMGHEVNMVTSWREPMIGSIGSRPARLESRCTGFQFPIRTGWAMTAYWHF